MITSLRAHMREKLECRRNSGADELSLTLDDTLGFCGKREEEREERKIREREERQKRE